MSEHEDKGECRVFVYGTLKKNNCNNIVLRESGAVLLGRDTIHGEFKLGQMGGLPAVFVTPDEEYTVRGETWSGSEEMLAACDLLECHPTWYRRTKVLSTKLKKRVWVYIMQDSWEDMDLTWPKDGMYNPSSAEKQYWKRHGS